MLYRDIFPRKLQFLQAPFEVVEFEVGGCVTNSYGFPTEILPFGYIMDKWRWQVFAGETSPERYNQAWSELRLKYQGIANPGPRPPDAFAS
jgi:hypothetical protein